ncbi:MAG: ATP-binding protein, partial [Mycobacterium sp.]
MPSHSSVADSASQRQVMRRATTVGLLMRNTVNLVVAAVALADPASAAQPLGEWLLGTLGVWSLYRIATRSHRVVFVVVDYALVLAVCAAISVLVADPVFYTYNTAPQAIAGTAVISFAVVLPARVSLPMAVVVAVTYAGGAAAVTGWDRVADIGAVYYFALQWATAALIRIMLLRVAAAVDRVGSEREAATLNQRVSDAVRDYEREQLALLHDTAASTLLMVGQGAPVPPRRLAAQAQRDLELLH